MAQAALLTKRSVILAKVETSYRATTTPTAADNAVEVINPRWSHESLRMIERNTVKPSLGMKQSIYGGAMKSITFDVELKGSGAAGTAPDIGELFEGCGMDETVSASTSVTYAPISTGQDSLTLWFYLDGKLVKMDGCRGTWSLNAPAGEILAVSFTFTGHILTTTDVSLVSPTYDATAPETFRGATFSVNSYAAAIGALSLDFGNTISVQPDVNDAQGFGEVLITGRNVGGSIDPLATLVATNDWEGDFRAGTNGSLTTGAIGATAGNIVTITCPQTYFRDLSLGDRDGAYIYDIPLGCNETASGDDEISLVFT